MQHGLLIESMHTRL